MTAGAEADGCRDVPAQEPLTISDFARDLRAIGSCNADIAAPNGLALNVGSATGTCGPDKSF